MPSPQSLDCASHEIELTQHRFRSRRTNRKDRIPIGSRSQRFRFSCAHRSDPGGHRAFQLRWLHNQCSQLTDVRHWNSFPIFGRPHLWQRRRGWKFDPSPEPYEHRHGDGQYLSVHDFRHRLHSGGRKPCFIDSGRPERHRSDSVRTAVGSCRFRQPGRYQRRIKLAAYDFSQWKRHANRIVDFPGLSQLRKCHGRPEHFSAGHGNKHRQRQSGSQPCDRYRPWLWNHRSFVACHDRCRTKHFV